MKRWIAISLVLVLGVVIAVIFVRVARTRAINKSVKELSSTDREVRWRAAHALGDIGPAARIAVPHLIDALKGDDDTNVRIAAAEALGKMGAAAKPAVPTLAAVLKDPYRTRESPSAGTSESGPGTQCKVPHSVLGHEYWITEHLQMTAAGALRTMGPEARDAIPALIDVLRNRDDYWVWPSVARALGSMGPEAAAGESVLFDAWWQSREGYERDSIEAALKDIAPADERIGRGLVDAQQTWIALGSVVSSVDLLPPEHIGPRNTIFRWSIRGGRSGIKYCSFLIVDKGPQPFDGRWEAAVHVGEPTEFRTNLFLEEGRYEWAVVVTVCRDPAATCCQKGTSCFGRSFKSEVFRFDKAR